METDTTVIKTDTALTMLGRYSRWQMRSYFVNAVGFGIPFAWMTMSIVFIGEQCMTSQIRSLIIWVILK